MTFAGRRKFRARTSRTYTLSLEVPEAASSERKARGDVIKCIVYRVDTEGCKMGMTALYSDSMDLALLVRYMEVLRFVGNSIMH